MAKDPLLPYIFSLGQLPPVSPTTPDAPAGPSSVTETPGWTTTIQPMAGVRDLDEIVTFGVDQEIWPGSILQGKHILDTAPAVVPLKRAPLTITLTGPVAAGGASMSTTVDDPQKSTVADAINKLLLQPNVASEPASLSVEKFQAYSTSQICANAGMNVKILGGSASAHLETSVNNSEACLVVTVVQKYYEVSASAPGPDAPYFAESVTEDDAAPYMSNDNPPVYVAGVTYGRRLMLILTSHTRQSSYDVDLDAAYNFGTGSASGTASTSSIQAMGSFHASLMDIGGSTDTALKLIESNPGDPGALEALSNYLHQGARWSISDSPGAIIGWKLRYVGSSAAVITSTPVDYNKRTFLQKARNVDLGVVIHQNASGRKEGDDWTQSYPFYPDNDMRFDINSVAVPYTVLRGSASIKNVDVKPDVITITVFTQSVSYALFGGHHSGEIRVGLKYREVGI